MSDYATATSIKDKEQFKTQLMKVENVVGHDGKLLRRGGEGKEQQ